ncbi:hypothetical protein AB0886_05305 [Streptomyces sp. NPDC024062]|uniref:hypothetical protein n=1 Tax=unclassified Streptomyces TaxID=2593676 RepID=UPI0034469294
MQTYAIRDARTKTTGHLRQDGTRTTYCNRAVGIPNGDFTGLKGWKMCQPCVRAEARDRAHAEEVAAQHAEPLTPTAEPATQPTAAVRDEPSDWWTIMDPATGEEITRVYGETYQEMTPRAEALPEVRAVIRAHKGFSRRRLYVSELTPAQRADQISAPAMPTAADRAAAARESRQMAELITEAEATDGTWRGQWIGDTTALFDRPTEQGSLFA